jgi:PilZ domain
MAEIKPWRFLSNEMAKALQGLVFEDVDAEGEHPRRPSPGASAAPRPQAGAPRSRALDEARSGHAGVSAASVDRAGSLEESGQVAYQKRQLTRIACLFRVGCEAGPRRFRATVVDLGVRGMRLDVPERLAEGTLLKVRYLGSSRDVQGEFNLDEVTTRVQWCRKKRLIDTIEVGVLYEDEEERLHRSWVHHVLLQVGFDVHSLHDRRNTIRVQALLHATLATTSSESRPQAYQGTVVNLGAGGALVEAAYPLPQGTSVRLEVGPYAGLGTLRCSGVVVSCQSLRNEPLWRMGVRFEGIRRPEAEQLLAYVRTLLSEVAEL